ncbi:sugar ABC transporter ATP-binding protein [Periweissella cryptocerci]|uniref:Sugar ABC transporter ATP-binding protein n=1 Tax=Periweissella cryptocerci TaxID=2506420 RepID=A0A4P6YW95_9LACO|nr:sugar ABC transporter ATP-binding protein [Periweissella cryptocerci]QBO37043.1 sugar ABC transporter ATP-binding protein [Periweissella cryptocerci]
MQIEMKNISKSFGTNHVLQGVDFKLGEARIHALMGENGAGKSTLMNILTGLLSHDGGTIEVDGQTVQYSNAKDAEEHGISFIHQEMNNYSEMTVVENMFINREIKGRFGVLDMRAMRKQATHYLDMLGADIDVDQPIGTLSVGRQQLIEIAKSLMADAKVIIMDEPTAALTATEIELLFKTVRDLRDKGVGFIYISHRMEEIMALCDDITIMRDGISVSHYEIKDTTIDQIVRDMVGREIGDFYPERKPDFGDVYFEADQLTSSAFENVSFKVRSGEIMAFAGLMGAGRTEIMRAIFGIDKLDSGTIKVRGKKVENRTPHEAIQHGIGFVTENRKDEGLILEATLQDNIDLPSIDGFVKHGLIDQKADLLFVETLMKRLTVKATSSQDLASSLSGGNQQKVVLAKWVGAGSQVLILDEPTRGVDVGAKREIYDLMNELTDRGVAIIMISSDLPEVIGMSDNITVIYEGHVTGQLATKDADQEKIMTLATGGEIV